MKFATKHQNDVGNYNLLKKTFFFLLLLIIYISNLTKSVYMDRSL